MKRPAELAILTGLALFVGCKAEAQADVRLPEERLDEGELFQTISEGHNVDVSDHLVRGKWTLFEFTADW